MMKMTEKPSDYFERRLAELGIAFTRRAESGVYQINQHGRQLEASVVGPAAEAERDGTFAPIDALVALIEERTEVRTPDDWLAASTGLSILALAKRDGDRFLQRPLSRQAMLSVVWLSPRQESMDFVGRDRLEQWGVASCSRRT
jgi:hypothetical protein